MAGWFRRKKKKVADQANVSRIGVAGQPLQAGQIESFDPEQRMARAKARLNLCELKIELLRKVNAGESELKPWISERRRRRVQIEKLGG
jgi:hypothetical protein